jgi:hypothetical protein
LLSTESATLCVRTEGREGERERTQVEGVALPLGAPVEATARRSTGVTFGHPESSDFDDMMESEPKSLKIRGRTVLLGWRKVALQD